MPRARLDLPFAAVVFVVALAVVLVGLELRFARAPEPPPLPPRPAAASRAVVAALEYSHNVYRASVERDARSLGVATVPDELRRPFPADEVTPGVRLLPGAPPLETRDLRLSVHSDRVITRYERGSVTSPHLVLRIENRTDRPVAYRIDTHPEDDPTVCRAKGDLRHNAIALAPREVVQRTECLHRHDRAAVRIERVASVVLPELSYHYVSRLHPAHVLVDSRVARGHRSPGDQAVCSTIPEQAIRLAAARGTVAWRDVIDFYARHDCERYLFPIGYRAFARTDQRPLPVSPGSLGGGVIPAAPPPAAAPRQ